MHASASAAAALMFPRQYSYKKFLPNIRQRRRLYTMHVAPLTTNQIKRFNPKLLSNNQLEKALLHANLLDVRLFELKQHVANNMASHVSFPVS